MTSESGERRPARPNNHLGSQHPAPEHLPCPRCDSTNTKFCYYNNYNLSQPRHFCKSCRRYWTHGGTLRNIPIGGGTRKNSKRSSSSSSSSSYGSSGRKPAVPILGSNLVKPETDSTLNSNVNVNENVTGGFSSLLNSNGPGFLALGGYGLGFGSGFDEMGYGLNRGVWTFPELGESGGGGGGGGGGGDGSVASSVCNTWPINGGGVEGGWSDGDCLGWPDLAISMPGKGLK